MLTNENIPKIAFTVERILPSWIEQRITNMEIVIM